MRMRKRQNLAPRMEACRSVWLEDAAYLRGNWRSLMPQARELRLEIGCGKGKFTVETAALEPDVLFVAVERVQEALVLAMEKALSMGLKNVYFLSIDAARLEEYFAPGEVDLIYLNFCDPWPRKKNAKRRLTFHTFLKKVVWPSGKQLVNNTVVVLVAVLIVGIIVCLFDLGAGELIGLLRKLF